MTIRKLNGGADVHWNVIDSRAEIIKQLADDAATGKLYAVRQGCWHIANDADMVRRLNREHRTGYLPERDDQMQPHLDRIGDYLRDETLVQALPRSYVELMRAAVSAIRGALFARMTTQRREEQPAQNQRQTFG